MKSFLKKHKNKLISLISLSTISSISTITLSSSTILKTKDNNISLPQIINESKLQLEENKWKIFLNNDAISFLLDLIYQNEEDKQKYIKSQQDIDSAIYLADLRRWRYYYSQTDNISDGQPPFGFTERGLPSTQVWGRRDFKDLINYNWLWYLFNMTKFEYILVPEKDDPLGKLTKDKEDLLSKTSLTKQIYRPTSNTFVQSSQIIYEDTTRTPIEVLKNKRRDFREKASYFWILNNDGFWFSFDVVQKFDLETNEFKYTNVDFFPKLYTLPKLLEANGDFKHFFSLQRYTDATYGSRVDVGQYPTFFITNLNDEFGGEKIFYDIVDSDKD